MNYNNKEFYESCIRIAAICVVFFIFKLCKALDLRIRIPSTSFVEILLFCILFILLLLYEFNANDIKYKLYMKRYAKTKAKDIRIMIYTNSGSY